MLMNTGTGSSSPNNGRSPPYLQDRRDQPAVYAPRAWILAVAGSLVQWLRDNPGYDRQAPTSAIWPDGRGQRRRSFRLPAFSGLLAPYWRSDARGAIKA